MKKLLSLLAIVLAVLIVIVLFRTFTFKSKQIQAESFSLLNVSDSSITHLQKAISYKTISFDDPHLMDSSAFQAFHQFLSTAYPLAFSKLSIEKVNDLSLLLHWKGKSNTDPLIMMAHQDVVPVEEASLNQWEAAPFSGGRKDGYVYGRGAIDDKGSLIAILEATELLLQQGHVPANDIYFAFGHDEEVSGRNGARPMAELLKERNIKPKMILDEGGIITENKVPGLKKTAAVVGIAEKGYVTVQLQTQLKGGHSSMPEKETAIDQLAAAIEKLKNNPFEPGFGSVIHSFMDYVGPELPFVSKMAMANRWLFKPLIINTYSKSPAGDATIRTTTAFTMFNAGVKENLVPEKASAVVNFRTQPNVGPEDVVEHVRSAIDNKNIQVILQPNSNHPEAIAQVEDASFKYLQKSISSFKKDIVVAPYLMLGASDGRYFSILTPQVFRFIPFTDIEGLHGVNERIQEEEFKKGISFYYYFLKNYSF